MQFHFWTAVGTLVQMAQRGADFSQPAGAGLKNSVRFLWKERETEMMGRYEFVKGVLLKVLKVDPENCWCLQRNMAVKSFDLTCVTECFEEMMERCRENEDVEPLSLFEASSLACKNYKIITMHLYNPFVADEVIESFLGRYGSMLPGARHLRDSFGIWNGKRQFRVVLKEDPKGYDELCHPPAYFS